MTTSSTAQPITLRAKRTLDTTLTLAAFRAPPLRPPSQLDIARDLDAVRRRRNLLSQRIGAVWLRGHVRDL